MMGNSQKPLTLITGAGRGIGFGIAQALAASGHDLAIIEKSVDAKTKEAMAMLEAAGAQVLLQQGDIADLDRHDALVTGVQEKFGRIDHLVNNAGIGALRRGDFLTLSPQDFDALMGVNLRGTVFFTQAVVKAMAQAARPAANRTIVNITSVSAALTSPERLDYCMSKAALSAFSAGLALRAAACDISVFELRPGIIQTDMTKMVAQKYDQQIAGGLVPLKRWGQPQDIGSIVAQLVSGNFAFATGSIIHADGGLSIHRL